MEAKTTKYHSIQAAEVTCSKAISDTKAQTTSQATMFQEEHCSYLWGLEEHTLGEESRSHQDVLSSCQATLCHSPQLIRVVLAASYHLLLGQTPPLPSLIQPPRPLPWKNRHPQLPSHTDAQTISETKKATSFTRADREHAPGQSHPGSCSGGPPCPKK